MPLEGWFISAPGCGMVAQEFAVTHPERVERLALACTSAGGGGCSYPLQSLQELPPEERAAAQLRLADSRWDEHWLEVRPADRALAGRAAAQCGGSPIASTAVIRSDSGPDKSCSATRTTWSSTRRW